ncbi:MAG: hypothetical protein IT282_00140, partial [Bacteroidetes bacterium]|nr:hypothetical protein [Bacteroidota bacterium]
MNLIIGLTVLLLASSGLTSVSAQTNGHTPSKERVDPTLRRRTEMDGNNVRTSVFNFVFSGRTGAGQGVPYEWPKNTNRVYIALVALFVGGEVIDNSGTTIRIVDLPAYRTNPATGGDWNMGPVPGYFNPDQGKIAKSDEPATWPSFWPDKVSDQTDPGWAGSWNGFFGKNQFNADQEIYYRAGDDNYNRWDYSPDTTDPARRGLGMIVDGRALQWSQASVADAVFFIHEVKNDGTKDILKTGVTLWLADFVGGDGDSQDDSPSFDLILDIAFSLDADGRSSNPAFSGVPVGCAATLYLETPGNATDRIDNDGDSPEFLLGPRVTGDMFAALLPGTTPEVSGDQIDNNLNGLIDEDSTHIPFGQQRGVGFADGIDNDGNAEAGSPVITQTMVSQASLDLWRRWPADPEHDAFQQGIIHLIDVDGPNDLGKMFKDYIDNDGDSPDSLPVVTQDMVTQAAGDAFRRYRVPGTKIILFDVGAEDVGKKYINRDGLVSATIDEGIDEMIDEGRNDGIDNDGDWNPFTDDVGLDGAAETGDVGEGDGKPTSGVNTPFPGEPNIDKTDVSEADQIGLTNVQYLAAGAINFSTTADIRFWGEFMLPGRFVNPALIPTGESDLFVSSGIFPMKAGQIERISFAVVFGSPTTYGNARVSGAFDDALRKREFAQLAYNEDYQFAQAPLEPTVRAVVGDRRVTLYWDRRSEESTDRFLQGIPGAPAKDFEGYKIYRATDPSFLDARLITDGFGSVAPFLKPIMQFDLKNGIKGFHPTPYNGVQFYLGTDYGLAHEWTDSSVQNGPKYYYAVRAFDQGYTPLNITPSESNLKINIDNITGELVGKGTSVVIAVPEAPVAGYIAPSVSPITLVAGSTTGTIGYVVVDPDSVLDNHKYRITFEDTVHSGGTTAPDTFLTKTLTLADVTNPSRIDTLISRTTLLGDTVEHPITHGFRLLVNNERSFGVNADLSGWNRVGIYNFDFRQWKAGFLSGQQKPADYKVVFGPVGFDTSTAYVVRSFAQPRPAIPVNFKVFNTSENKQIDFAFWELDLAGGPGVFSTGRVGFDNVSDFIVFLEKDTRDSLAISWGLSMGFDSILSAPQAGDTLTVVLSKLFRQDDVFEFTTVAQKVDDALAQTSLDQIRVVPNPYVAAATWEERTPYTSGRGPRSIHFTHLPQSCTIRIFTVSGELVTTIRHEASMNDGTASWNLLTRDNLSV